VDKSDKEMIRLVEEARKDKMDQSHIIITDKKNLRYASSVTKIQTIMQSDKYREGLADPTVPECNQAWYNAVIWSKIPLISQASDMNPFKTDYFVWLDFGSFC
jgi:hypothetical protein